ncbi:MAG TPA: hypothetical protein VFI31_00135 [Pirellulales bacterium]|nr:hypothetical protein [Pirellulales bacterium]
MSKAFLKPILCLVASVCGFVALFSIWGFLCAFEPGQEAWLTIYPVVFAFSVAVGASSAVMAARP